MWKHSVINKTSAGSQSQEVAPAGLARGKTWAYLFGFVYVGLNALLLAMPLGVFEDLSAVGTSAAHVSLQAGRLSLPPTLLLLIGAVGLLIVLCATVMPSLAGLHPRREEADHGCSRLPDKPAQ